MIEDDDNQPFDRRDILLGGRRRGRSKKPSPLKGKKLQKRTWIAGRKKKPIMEKGRNVMIYVSNKIYLTAIETGSVSRFFTALFFDAKNENRIKDIQLSVIRDTFKRE